MLDIFVLGIGMLNDRFKLFHRVKCKKRGGLCCGQSLPIAAGAVTFNYRSNLPHFGAGVFKF
jgi:hypothetical protein